MYEQFKQDPKSVDPGWRSYFEKIEKEESSTRKQISSSAQAMDSSILYCKAKELVEGYRAYGHLMASVNPLQNEEPQKPKELELSYYALSEGDLSKEVPSFWLQKSPYITLKALVEQLEKIYCFHTG